MFMGNDASALKYLKRGGPAALVAAALLVLAVPGAVAGSGVVDNSALNPPAADWYSCTAAGANTICRGTIPIEPVVNEPTGWDCDGQPIYVTEVENVRVATRVYDANGDLDWRRVHATETDAMSLSPIGASPVVTVIGHWGWTVRYAVHGDTSTGMLASHGLEARVMAPDGHVLLHQAGTLYSAGDDFITTGWHGPHPIEEDFNNFLTAICSGLQR
jgi:hypothetical protein